MSEFDHTYAVILAGGGGTRLWPKSRTKTPKQLLRIIGKDTMIQVTAQRLSKLVNWDRMIIVTNELYLQEIKDQLPEVPIENVIAEPAKRDTALAMLVGTRLAQSRDPEAIVVNAASDHVVVDEKEYIRVMKAAISVAAKKNYLVAVGITPSNPATGFGYIKIDEDLGKADGQTIFKVASFTEKPNVATARAFIATGKYFWNANMYVWSAEALVKAFAKHKPEMHQLTEHLVKLSGNLFNKALPDIYDQAESISIDYAISEKADNLVLIPGDFGWNDVGDWHVVYDLGSKDLAGNVVIGDGENREVLTVHAQNNLIHTNGRLVAVLGVEDFIIIDTEEILMIVPKKRSQDVKKLVERLKEEKREDYL